MQISNQTAPGQWHSTAVWNKIGGAECHLKMEVCPYVQAHIQTQQQAAACKEREVALLVCDTGLGSCLCAGWGCTVLLYMRGQAVKIIPAVSSRYTACLFR